MGRVGGLTMAARWSGMESSMFIKRATRFASTRLARLAGRDPGQQLFRGDDSLFIESVAACTVYGEYGCGASTIWCANHSAVPIIAVDTSADWISRVRAAAERKTRLEIVHVDLGELGEWGRPVSYRRRADFAAYIEAPWTFALKPDLILVDGRFRVACFLQSLLNAAAGAVILFDDYTERPNYHLVEEFVARAQTCGTMAKFVVPDALDRDAIAREIKAFTNVMD